VDDLSLLDEDKPEEEEDEDEVVPIVEKKNDVPLSDPTKVFLAPILV